MPSVIRLSPDYTAELPLWGECSGNIPWQRTKFSPELLDRLAAWQQKFDENFHYDGTGWQSSAVRDHWLQEAEQLVAAVRAELGTRAELIVDLWPLEDGNQ